MKIHISPARFLLATIILLNDCCKKCRVVNFYVCRPTEAHFVSLNNNKHYIGKLVGEIW